MIEFWNRVEKSLIGYLSIAALIIACAQMFTRYFLPSHALDWAEEAVIYLTMWAIWLSGSQLVAADQHIRADLFIRLLSPGIRHWTEIFNATLGIVFCALVCFYAKDIVALAIELDERGDSSLQFPLWLYYASLLCGSGLMAVRYLLRSLDLLKNRV